MNPPFSFVGAVVPGKFRWVTTYIARFDPDVDWPSDLDFSMVVKDDLVTYAGVALLPSELNSVRFTTGKLSMSVSDIQSELASNATSGYWRPFTESGDFEAPPDAILSLSFSHPVDADLTTAALEVSGPTSVGVVNVACPPVPFYYGSSGLNRVCVSFDSPLTDRARYQLKLPAGSRYHSLAGDLQEELSVTIAGLLPFQFSFLSSLLATSYRRFDLYLRHGLAEGVDVEEFASVITISPSLSLSFSRPDNATLRISADTLPRRTYTLSCAASSGIRDAFGLPFEASSVTFTTADLPGYFVYPASDYVLFESSAPEGYDVLTQGPAVIAGGSTSLRSLSAYEVSTETLVEAVRVFAGDGSVESMSPLGPEGDSIVSTAEFQELSIATSGLLSKAGLFLTRDRTYSSEFYDSVNLGFVGETSVAANFIVEHRANELHLTAWVTSLSSGEPVPEARVSIFHTPFDAPLSLAGAGTTNPAGLVDFPLSLPMNRFFFKLHASVVQGGKITMFPSLDTPFLVGRLRGTNLGGTLITDRAVYTPGSVVSCKGYIREFLSVRSTVPHGLMLQVTILWGADEPETIRDISVDDEFGSFDFTLTVPDEDNVIFGPKTIVVEKGTETIAVGNIVVADPRPPTVYMEVEAPGIYNVRKADAGDMQAVTVTTKTYTGTTVAGAEVDCKWSIVRGSGPVTYVLGDSDVSPSPVEFPSEGVVTLTTGSDGTGALDLTTMLSGAGVRSDDRVFLRFVWTGPTREVIEEEVELAAAPSVWTPVISLTDSSPLPGADFAVRVGLVNAADGDSAVLTTSAVPLEISLHRIGTAEVEVASDGTVSVSAPASASCDTTYGAADPLACTFSLNSVDRYAILVHATGPEGEPVSSAVVVGRTPQEWEDYPLSTFGTLSAMLDKESYMVGEQARVSFFSPFSNARGVLLRSNLFGSTSSSVAVLPGRNTFDFPVESTCLGGCHVTLLIAVPRQGPSKLASNPHRMTLPVEGGTVELPVSSLLDVNMPRHVEVSLVMPVVDTSEVTISTNLPDRTFLPGEEVSLTVRASEGVAASDAEICIMVVNKAFLDLLPHPLADPKQETQSDTLGAAPSAQGTQEFLVTPEGYQATSDVFARRQALDPWSTPTWSVRQRSHAEVDVSDERYFSVRTTRLTDFPFGPWVVADDGDVVMQSTGAAGPSGGDVEDFDGGGGGGAAPSADREQEAITTSAKSSLRILDDRVVTPYFEPAVRVNSMGEATVSFRVPSDVGTFVVRTYATSKTGRLGAAEAEIISRRPINLQPSQPRIVRNGDSFAAGVTVTMADAEFDGTVTVSMSVEGAVEAAGVLVKTVEVTGAAPVEVTFDLTATKGLGGFKLTFSATASSSQADAISSPTISVLGKQDPVFVATSMAVTASTPGRVWEEGLSLPAAVPGSGVLNVSACVGRLSAVRGLTAAIRNQRSNEVTVQGETAAASLAIAVADHAYAGSASSLDTAALQTALHDLRHLTTPSVGLRWMARFSVYDTWVDTHLQAFALFMAHEAGDAVPPDLKATWANVLKQELKKQARAAVEAGTVYSDCDMLAMAYLVLPVEWPLSLGMGPQETDSLSLQKLQRTLDQCSVAGKAAYALDAVRRGVSTSSPPLSDVISLLESLIRVQGRTAYVAHAPGAQSASSTWANALSLMVLLEAGSTHPSLEKLANYVAGGAGVRRGGCFESTQGLAGAVLALSRYDVVRGSSDPDLTLDVRSYHASLLDGAWTAGNAREVVHSSSPWEYLYNPPPPLRFYATGRGEVSIAVGMAFVPEEMFASAVYRGIFVEKSIQAIDLASGNTFGPSVSSVVLGEMYRVTLQVTSPDDLGAVCIVDGLPGGLEARDPALDTTTDVSSMVGAYHMMPWMFRWWSPFVRETRPDRVQWCSPYFFAGTYSVSYDAVAATAGSFALPPARAYAKRQPEVMGLSPSGVLRVVRPGDSVGPPPPDPPLPVACATPDCSGHGVCDVGEGVCLCDAAFGGDACDEEREAGSGALGEACAGDAECASGACADGVCCDTLCLGSCESCAVSGREGQCVNEEACCELGVVFLADTCDEQLPCHDAGTTSCRPFGCNPDGTASCATSCNNETSPCLFASTYCDASTLECHDYPSSFSHLSTVAENGIPLPLEEGSSLAIIIGVLALLIVALGSGAAFLLYYNRSSGMKKVTRAVRLTEEEEGRGECPGQVELADARLSGLSDELSDNSIREGDGNSLSSSEVVAEEGDEPAEPAERTRPGEGGLKGREARV